MPTPQRRLFLLGCLLLTIVLPLVGSWIHWQGLPPGFGVFPTQQGLVPHPSFNGWYFAAGCVTVLAMTGLLVAPRVFGFKSQEPVPASKSGPLPPWFAPAVVTMAVSWGLMWFGPGPWARFTFVPLWWGFIIALDGLVYARTHGRSLLAHRKSHLLLMAIVSVGGWYLFEFWNYFVLENWYYPHATLLPPALSVAWFTLSFTTVWPACFEWYMVLESFPALALRWSSGPKLRPSRLQLWALLGVGVILASLMGVFPFQLFWALWFAPLLIFEGALQLAGVWTPFVPAARGDWSKFVLMALATLFNGFVWEVWNYGSQAFRGGVPTNPNFWLYDVPYFNVLHVFSEMPALGYFGYLFFGVLAWSFWLVVAHVCQFEPEIDRMPRPAMTLPTEEVLDVLPVSSPVAPV